MVCEKKKQQGNTKCVSDVKSYAIGNTSANSDGAGGREKRKAWEEKVDQAAKTRASGDG